MIARNQSWTGTITLLNFNLTGVPLWMHIRTNAADPSPLVELSTANGKISIVDAAAGKLQLALTETDTAALTIGQCAWDLVRSDTKQRITGGYLIVAQGVTR